MKTNFIPMLTFLFCGATAALHGQTEAGGGAASGAPSAGVATGGTVGGQPLDNQPVVPAGVTRAERRDPSAPANATPAANTVVPLADELDVTRPGAATQNHARENSPTSPRSALGTATPGSVAPAAGSVLPGTGTVSPGTAPIGPEPLITSQSAGVGAPSDRSGTAPRRPDDPPPTPQPSPEPGVAATVVVTTPPPPQPAESVTPQTSEDQVWVPGHYTWQNGSWMWVSGQWAAPPTPNAVWVPGRYDAQTQRWTEGHWNTTAAPRIPLRRSGP